MTGRVAMIAGEGGLPRHLANALGRSGRSWFSCHLEGHAPSGVGQSRGFRVERLGSFLEGLKEDGVEEVVLAGRVARPSLDPTAVDAATLPMVPRMAAAIASGDDGALRGVIGLIEEAGIAVVAPQDLAPDLTEIPDIGAPTGADAADIARARDVLAALGPLDVGQGCVVAGGQVLAVEALPGTDWMLASLAPASPSPPGGTGGGLFGGMADWLSGPGAPRGLPDFPRPEGGVLIKMPKPDQDRRVDLPTIGPDTMRHVAAARFERRGCRGRGRAGAWRPRRTARIARGSGLFLATFERA